MPRALVTGASGFAGGYLVRHLLQEGYEVIAGTHGKGELPEGCERVNLDVTDAPRMATAIEGYRPDEVYHLAGITRPASGDISAFYEVNFHGALNLLQAVGERSPRTAVLLVGSAYAYGKVDYPIPESRPLEPVNHYGVSKASVELLARTYVLQGLRVVLARPFNHSGPGQSPDFVLPTIVEQFAKVRSGEREPVIRLGNLESVRDFCDVRDVLHGYRLALAEGRSGAAYNFGSGQGFTVRQLFDLVREQSDMEVELVVEPSRVRATDMDYLVANTERSRTELGWTTGIPLHQTVREMLEAAFADRSGRQ